MTDWSVHPYYALNGTQARGEAEAIHDELRGRARNMWITEIGAYYCNRGALMGEAQQRARAQRLVGEVAPRLEASHTFYYEFLRGNGARPPCESGGTQADSSLYKPDDEARSAARVILEAGGDAGPAWWWGFGAPLGWR
jgi:hypothetical protein